MNNADKKKIHDNENEKQIIFIQQKKLRKLIQYSVNVCVVRTYLCVHVFYVKTGG